MNIKMDKFGRILIPKAVRERKGLTPGDEFDLEDDGECSATLSLEKRQRVKWARVPSELPWPVYDLIDEAGDPVDADIDWENAVRDAREERIDDLVERLA